MDPIIPFQRSTKSKMFNSALEDAYRGGEGGGKHPTRFRPTSNNLTISQRRRPLGNQTGRPRLGAGSTRS